MSDVIGELLVDESKVCGQWKIRDFPALTEVTVKMYYSLEFLFLGCWWRLGIYPNDEVNGNSKGWISIYLNRVSVDFPRAVCIGIGFKNMGGQTFLMNSAICTFSINSKTWGRKRIIEVSDLLRRKKELLPSGTLTICYTLENCAQYPLEDTFSRRLWNASQKWNDILSHRKRTDVVLKLEDGELQAHRMVLESSSAVFQSMFGVNMKESRTGEVNIEDATVSAFQVALSFIYSGDPIGLSSENVFDVYTVAHKYELEELTKFSTKLMRATLCVNTVCRVIAFADLYGETSLKEFAVDYFAKNKADIFKTEEWNAFKMDNPKLGFEVVECVLARYV